MTTFQCALRRDLICPIFHSQKTTLPSLSPLLIHFPSREKSTWHAFPATEWLAKHLLPT